MSPGPVAVSALDGTFAPYGPNGIRFKGPAALAERLQGEFERKLDGRLVVLTFWAHGWLLNKYGMPAIVTCIIRTPEENRALYGDDRPSVHTTGRGIDFRVVGGGFATTVGASLAEAVNGFFVYGKMGLRRVALFEPAQGGRAPHCHFQVPGTAGPVSSDPGRIVL